jgi:hypothetical protein
MEILAIALVLIGIYLVVKVAGFVLKMAFLAVVIGAIYWLIAPMLGLPQPWVG